MAIDLHTATGPLTDDFPLLDEQDGFREGVGLSRRLFQADTPGEAVRIATRFVSRGLHRPVAGWLGGSATGSASLAAAFGLGSDAYWTLRRSMQVVPRWSQLTERGRGILQARFADITGCSGIVAVEAGEAVLFLADDTGSVPSWVRDIGSMLGEALESVVTVSRARLRDAQLDQGLAWTAHELRGPILAARMAMDRILQREDLGPDRGVALLARQQLEGLGALVDDLLHWSVGMGRLKRTRGDLVRVVRQAIEGSSMDAQGDRVTLEAPDRVLIVGDLDHLRSAASNLIRNALAYSPPDTTVRVEVTWDEGRARVRVSDQGPGISESEREVIFDPFVRGRAGQRAKGGGLGLFIARRVVEAHGGTMSLESGEEKGSTFFLEVPAPDQKEKQPSAS